jgi:hypothetical protein
MNLEEILAIKKSYQDAVATHGKSALQLLFNDFFGKHPEVEILSWTQYIPGFNDGEPCMFTMGELGVKLVNGGYLDEEDAEEDFFSSWNLQESNPSLSGSMDSLEINLGELEDLCQEVFSLDVRILVYKDRIETEEYECGY